MPVPGRDGRECQYVDESLLFRHVSSSCRSERQVRYSLPTTRPRGDRELVELIFEQPYCRIRNVVDAGVAERQTAAVYLKQLAKIGVLKEVKVGREKLFINPRSSSGPRPLQPPHPLQPYPW